MVKLISIVGLKKLLTMLIDDLTFKLEKEVWKHNIFYKNRRDNPTPKVCSFGYRLCLIESFSLRNSLSLIFNNKNHL